MKRNTKHFLFWTLLLCISVFSALKIISIPSGTENSWLFSLSLQRFTLVLIPGISILTCTLILILFFCLPKQYKSICSSIMDFSLPYSIISGSISVWCIAILGPILFLYQLFISPNLSNLTPILGYRLPTLFAYLDRLWPLIAFILLCMIFWIIYVNHGLKQPITKNKKLFIMSGLFIFILIALLFQWIVFFFNLHVFEQIPGWYWPIIQKPDFISHGLFFIFVLFLLLLILFSIKHFSRAYLLNLFIISLLFIVLQASIGVMEGRGIASLTDRFFLSYHRIYTEEACNSTIPVEQAISQYEVLYPSMFLQTKPPGVLWFAYKINTIANSPVLINMLDHFSNTIYLSKFLPRMTSLPCQRSMSMITLLFPFLASSTVWIIFLFSKYLIHTSEFYELASYSAILYILAPNIIMLSLFMDQSIYPPLFLFLTGFTLYSMQKKSFITCLLSGVALYAVIFLSFSMLPLLAIPIFYFISTLWQENRLNYFWHDFKISLLPLGIGILLSMFLFKLYLNYDIITRYQRMMETRIEGDFYTRLGISSSGSETFLVKIQQTWNAAILNNIEMAIAIGIPVFILFILMGIRSLSQVIHRTPDKTASINTSLFLSYLSLNIMRVVLGEVARLWMFWVPIIVLLAVQYLLPLIRRNQWIIYGLIIMQIISLFLSYQSQDYLMPQLLP